VKLRILIEEILLISLKLNSTPNTLGCYGLMQICISLIINFVIGWNYRKCGPISKYPALSGRRWDVGLAGLRRHSV